MQEESPIDSNEQHSNAVRLALQHRERIWAYLMALSKDPNRAEDLFQETYLVILEKSAQFQAGTDFLAWALKIAKFKFLASVDPQRNRHVQMEAEVLEQTMLTPEDRSGSDAEQREALAHCLEKLGPVAREALRLRYNEGLKTSEIAGRINTTTNALYALLSRVRQTLQACVEQRLRAAGVRA